MKLDPNNRSPLGRTGGWFNHYCRLHNLRNCPLLNPRSQPVHTIPRHSKPQDTSKRQGKVSLRGTPPDPIGATHRHGTGTDGWTAPWTVGVVGTTTFKGGVNVTGPA